MIKIHLPRLLGEKRMTKAELSRANLIEYVPDSKKAHLNLNSGCAFLLLYGKIRIKIAKYKDFPKTFPNHYIYWVEFKIN